MCEPGPAYESECEPEALYGAERTIPCGAHLSLLKIVCGNMAHQWLIGSNGLEFLTTHRL